MARRRWLPLLLVPPALVALLFNAWDFVGLWLDHDRTVEESGEQCLGLAREVSRSITATLQAVEIHLTDHLKPVAGRFFDHTASRPDLIGAFQLTAQRLPQVAAVMLFDSSGHLVESSRRGKRVVLSIGDQPWFRHHSEDGIDQSVFVAALDGAAPDARQPHWQLHVGRSLRGEDGQLSGVVVVALDTEYLFGLIGEMKIITGASVRIFDGDMRMLVNHPRDFTQIGRVFDQTRTVKTWRRVQTDLSGRLGDPTDDTPEIGAFRRVDRYPVLVSVGLAEDLALAEWWRELAILLGTIAIFMVASGWSMRRDLARWVLQHDGDGSGFIDGDGI